MRRILPLLALAGLMAGAAWLGRATAPAPPEPTDPSPSAGATANARKAGTAEEKPRPIEPDKAEAMVRGRGSTALSLLAMAQLTGDGSWLRRAAEEHPREPRVLLALYHAAKDPAGRASALAAYRAADPDNALGGYLAAWEAGQAGDPTGLAAALVDASFAEGLRREEIALVLEADAMLRATGLADREAFIQAMSGLEARDTVAMAGLGRNMGELQRLFVELGDWDEADFLLEQTLSLGDSMRQGGLILDNMVGISVERQLLGALDPQTVIGWDGERAGDRLAQLEAEQAAVGYVAGDWVETATAQLGAEGWAEYRRRLAEEGELAALRWLKDR